MKNLTLTLASFALAATSFSLPALAGESTLSGASTTVPQRLAQSSVEKSSTSEDLVERVKSVYAEICSKSRASVDRTVVAAPEPPAPITPAPRVVTPQLW